MVDEKYNQPKEYFSLKLKETMCKGYIEEHNIDPDSVVDAREYCQGIMQRYITLLDNATYMPCEHIQKEKEYGIPWRSAFKAELEQMIDALAKRTISADGFDEDLEDPFELLHKIVKKDAIDAATFDAMTQADCLIMLVDNLELLEKTVYTVKALLKEPEFQHFDEVKEKVHAKVKAEQLKQNPERPDTARLNEALMAKK